jgi:glycosyltransferase involved in cell wall biosynthesis
MKSQPALRILICSENPPVPPITGLRLVLRALLQELQKRHQLRVVCLATPEEALQCDPVTTRAVVLRQRWWGRPMELARATVTGRPVRVDNLAAALVRPLAEELARFEPDVVHVTGELASLGRNLDGYPSVLAPLDAAHRNWEAQVLTERRLRRLLVAMEADRVRRFEQSEYSAFGRVVVVSENDRDALNALSEGLRVVVIPNGVDSNYYAPDSTRSDTETVAFHGVMDWPPNVSAACYLADRVWPLVLVHEPEARLMLIGRNPAPQVKALGRRPSITVTGEVVDVRTWLRRAAVYACPMISGTGIKNKLLEAMAVGLACVTTSRALGGLRVAPGRQLLVADGDEEFAAAIVSLFRDVRRRRALGRAARELVRAAHSWERTAHDYEAVYRELTAEFR